MGHLQALTKKNHKSFPFTRILAYYSVCYDHGLPINLSKLPMSGSSSYVLGTENLITTQITVFISSCSHEIERAS